MARTGFWTPVSEDFGEYEGVWVLATWGVRGDAHAVTYNGKYSPRPQIGLKDGYSGG